MIIKRKYCVICSSPQKRDFIKIGHRNIVKCSKCSYTYADEYNTDDLDRIYDDDYYSPSNTEKMKAWASSHENIWEGLVQDLLTSKEKINTLLDIGAGTGGFLKKLQDTDPSIKLYAIESSDTAQKYLQEFIDGLEFPCKSADDLKNIRDKYDAITLLQCLEHLHDPLETLKNIYSLLNDEGVLLLTIPNRYSYEIFSKGLSNSLCYANGTHLQFFSRKSIKDMLSAAGFKSIKRICWFEKKRGFAFIIEVLKWLFRKLGISTELRYVIKKNI